MSRRSTYSDTLTIDTIEEHLAYSEDARGLIWRRSGTGRSPIGTRAGTINDRGYRMITIGGTDYREHVLVLWLINGAEPSPDFDIHHQNLDKADNRYINLMLLTRSEHIREHWRIRKAAMDVYLEENK